MLKKNITYTNFNDEVVTEAHYFHLSKADLVTMEMSHKGGLQRWIEKITESQDGAAIIAEFEKLILAACGKKSDDGTRFVKTQELRDEFRSSEAYSALFMELVTDAGKAAEFVNGIIPQGLAGDMAKIKSPTNAGQEKLPTVDEVREKALAEEESEGSNLSEAVLAAAEAHRRTEQTPQILTRTQAVEMDGDELQSGLATGKYRLG